MNFRSDILMIIPYITYFSNMEKYKYALLLVMLKQKKLSQLINHIQRLSNTSDFRFGLVGLLRIIYNLVFIVHIISCIMYFLGNY